MEQSQLIETSLKLRLPLVYLAIFEKYPLPKQDCSLLDDAQRVVELTSEYRIGFGGAPPWPNSWLYLGDSDDACPVVLDVETGRVIRTDHGNYETTSLEEWNSIWEYVSECLSLFY